MITLQLWYSFEVGELTPLPLYVLAKTNPLRKSYYPTLRAIIQWKERLGFTDGRFY